MASRPILVGAVRGLISDGERVSRLIDEHEPDIVGISVSKEGMDAMASAEMMAGLPANIEEKIYIRGLSKYGKVLKPPPCFMQAYLKANQLNIGLVALDMDDEHYTASYCKYIGTLDMMRQGRRGREMARHVFRARNPRDFVVEWDRLVNRLSDYKALEQARERWLAKRIAKLVVDSAQPLVIIEYERLAGVARCLRQLNAGFSLAP